MEKRTSPLGTKATLELDVSVAAEIVPAIPVTSASISIVSVTLACPATVWSSTVCWMRVTHSDSTAPAIAPGVQPSETSLTLHSSPSASGSGYGIRSWVTVTAPTCPIESFQEKVRDGTGPCRGSEYSTLSPSARLAASQKRNQVPSGPPNARVHSCMSVAARRVTAARSPETVNSSTNILRPSTGAVSSKSISSCQRS